METLSSASSAAEVRPMRLFEWALKSCYWLVRFGLRPDVGRFYTSLGGDLMGLGGKDYNDLERPLWLNQGYWKESTTYPEACAAMAHLLAEKAQLGLDDEVLDVGFGFGQQDLMWSSRYRIKRIYGINITFSQVAVARRRVAARGLSEKIELSQGSATALPFSDASFDKVLSLESAIHFDLREDFLVEAFRVLRPGGVLAFTDLLTLPGTNFSHLKQRLSRRMMFFPEGNLYTKSELVQKLSGAGFRNILCDSISEFVFPGITKYRARHLIYDGDGNELQIRITNEDIEQCRGREEYLNSVGVGDYVVVVARKVC